MKTKILISLILLLAVSSAVYAQEQQEAEITKLSKTLTLRVFADYKLMIFQQNAEPSYFTANKPLDLGIGIGIFGFIIKFSMSIPVRYQETETKKGLALDIKIDRFGTGSYNYAYLQYNTDFWHVDRGPGETATLNLLNIGLTHEIIFNKNHSLSSVYVLDKKQSMSNGSLLLGGGVFFSSMKSGGYTAQNAYKDQYYLHFGPNIGYSYTWIFNKSLFLNMLLVGGTDLMISLADKKLDLHLGLQALPKFSFGYHGDKISWNVYLTGSYLFAYPGKDRQLNLFTGNIGATFIWRIK
ncbi:MAG: DUF4421 domain-containing protein [Treponema sp.]|jgi:hypothetical protein|nr:DUF4421 domain-containing protein [Treponema sp.]